MEKYNAALKYAAEKHEGQQRKGGEPYITHPIAVAEKLREWGYGIDYQLAGLFHDLIEDTDATEGEILRLSNEHVLCAVKLLTKTDGYNMTEYIAGIRGNEIAFAVKGADRLHNLESAFCADIEFRRKYVKESREWYMDFRPEMPAAVAAIEETIKYDIQEYYTEDFYVCFCDTENVETYCDTTLFSDYRKSRLEKLARESAKESSAAAEMMLIHAIKHRMPHIPLPLQYEAGEHGKLYIPKSDIYFNLSHSGSKAACILAKKPCGIDIQEIKKPNMKLVEKYYTERERAMCPDGFTRIWTRKEAVAKADGRGLGIGIGSYDVCDNTVFLNGVTYNIYDIPASGGYTLAIAVQSDIK
ncbi:MAG: HD domain-containing protein [Oscillospiraceae bacterium]|nr:HD domain-containing protein [Oscillospiraceae bacterium]